MFRCLCLIYFLNFMRESDSSIYPLILYNNDVNGINMEFLDENVTFAAENSSAVYLTHYKVRALDYNLNEKYLIWSSSVYPYPMYCGEFKNKFITSEKIRIQVFKLSVLLIRSSQPTRLAIDWIHNLVYYFTTNSLAVMHVFQPEVSYVLTNSLLYNRGGIIVNPIDSFIIWTEYAFINNSAIIRKSNQDGSNQQILVYENIRVPICIAIDYEMKLIFWIDNELHSLSSITYNGTNRQTLAQSKELFEGCSSMDIFDNYVYWSSPKDNKIMRISKFGSNLEETVVISDNDIDFVKIIHSMRPQNTTNYCSKANCSHICLPSGEESYRCLCAAQKYQKLFLDNNECNEVSPLFPGPVVFKPKSNISAISELVSSNDPLLLIAAHNRDIRVVKLPTNRSIFYMDAYFLQNIEYYAFAIDYNFLGNYLVWLKSASDLYRLYSSTNLFVSPIVESQDNTLNINETKSLFNTSITTDSITKSLAIDWVHNLAYFPLCGNSLTFLLKGIFVVNLTSPETLFYVIPQSTCIVKDIEVDPIESIIIWSEYSTEFDYYLSYPYSSRYTSSNSNNNNAKIKKSSQDGSHIEILVDSNIAKPSTLTLDFNEKKIYWIDSGLYTLSSIYYNGTRFETILSSQLLFEYSFSSMDLYEDNIYWSSHEHDAILKTNKNGLNGTKIITVLQAGHNIESMKIMHNSSQPNAKNKCLNSNCSHICLPSNRENNYKCFCPQGLNLDGTQCQIIDSSISKGNIDSLGGILENGSKLLYIVYLEGIYLKQNLDDSKANYIDSIELYSSIDWLTEIEFNYNGNYILWLESTIEGREYSLYAAPIDKTKNNSLGLVTTKLLDSKTYISKRIAFDWIHDLVYISVPTGIQLISIDDNVYKYDVVSHNEIQGDLAVDPIESIIVWSQWSHNLTYSGKIYKALFDGSSKTLLTSESIEIPNTITIDLNLKTVYWIDTELYTLNSINYINGNNRTILITSKSLFYTSFSMDVFGDYIYWSNYDKDAILKTNKYGLNRTEKITVVYASSDLEGLKIIDVSRQPNATNYCLEANCSQLCIPLPNDGHTCVCSKNKISTCIERKIIQIESTTTSITSTSILNLSLVDQNQDIPNNSEKLDLLLSNKIMKNNDKIKSNQNSSNNWLYTLSFFSIGVNLTLIIVFIYRKKKMNPISRYILAKFQNDREEIVLNERLCDDE